MVKLSTHKSFSLASKKAKSVAVKSGTLTKVVRKGTKYEVLGGAL